MADDWEGPSHALIEELDISANDKHILHDLSETMTRMLKVSPGQEAEILKTFMSSLKILDGEMDDKSDSDDTAGPDDTIHPYLSVDERVRDGLWT